MRFGLQAPRERLGVHRRNLALVSLPSTDGAKVSGQGSDGWTRTPRQPFPGCSPRAAAPAPVGESGNQGKRAASDRLRGTVHKHVDGVKFLYLPNVIR